MFRPQRVFASITLPLMLLVGCSGASIPVGSLQQTSRYGPLVYGEVEVIELTPIKDVMTLNPDSYRGDNFAADDTLMTGADDSGWVWHFFIEFDASPIPPRSLILDAQLQLTPIESYDGGLDEAVFSVHEVIEPWDETALIWDTQPRTSPRSASQVTLLRESIEPDHFDLTPLMTAWSDGANNHGFMIRSADESLPIRKGYHSTTPNPDLESPEASTPKVIVRFRPPR